MKKSVYDKAFAISNEIMDNLLSEHPDLDMMSFSIIVAKMINSYAVAFVPDKEHPEYFDDMADNVRLFATVIRRDTGN